jgi:hypothetical protein
MKLIQAKDLQPGKMYYIESKCTQDVINKKRRQKGIFKSYIYGKVDVSDFDKGSAASYYAKLDIAHFEDVENINADDPAGNGITGSILYLQVVYYITQIIIGFIYPRKMKSSNEKTMAS